MTACFESSVAIVNSDTNGAAVNRQTGGTASFWPRPFWPPRNWWLALLAILVLAGALRYPGYDFGLPYVAHSTEGAFGDEAFYLLAAKMILDSGSAKPLNMHHYPPGNLAFNYIALRFFQVPNAPPSSVLPGLRLLSITFSLATLGILAVFGYHVAGFPAGLLAAGFLAVTPVMALFSRCACSDVTVTFFTVLTLWLTFVATAHRRDGWSVGATYALMLAITFKYSALALAPVVLWAPLLNGRGALRIVASNLGRFAIFAAWLLLLTPFLEAFQISEGENLAWAGIFRASSLPDLTSLLAILRAITTELSLLLLLPGTLGLLLLAKGRQRKEHIALGIIMVSVLCWLLMMLLVQTEWIAYSIPPISLYYLLVGIGYALLWREAGPWIARYRRVPSGLPAAVALLALLALNLPNAWAALNDTLNLTLPDQRNDLATWADQTVPASRYITNYDNHRTLNRDWGGYAGETHFNYAGDVFSDTPINEWRAQGVLFAIIPHFQYQLWREDGTNEFVTETTLLKSYPPSDAHRGPAMVVLLLQPIQHLATGQLGPIRLIGYDLAEESARPGELLPFHLYWQATAATEADYQVFNHLLDSEGNIVTQADGPPLPDPLLRRGTKDWDDPEEIIYSREYLLTLPEDLPSGEYSLVTGFYRRDNGLRLLSPAGEDALWVTRIAVE